MYGVRCILLNLSRWVLNLFFCFFSGLCLAQPLFVSAFKDFPAQENYKGKNVPLVLQKQDQWLRTRLREASHPITTIDFRAKSRLMVLNGMLDEQGIITR